MPLMRYTLEQRRFVYDTYLRKKSIKKCRHKINRRRTVITEEKLDDIAYLLENSLNKSLSKLAQQAGVSVSSVYKATKHLNFKPYKFAFSAPVMTCDSSALQQDNVSARGSQSEDTSRRLRSGMQQKQDSPRNEV
ncbi:hypothetical protein C0J52_20703 [Blattella germanica]|nr:hypothetical protein C0J52_20703 [Blattella germanica]